MRTNRIIRTIRGTHNIVSSSLSSGGEGGGRDIIPSTYVAQDDITAYVAEDGTTTYVTEDFA